MDHKPAPEDEAIIHLEEEADAPVELHFDDMLTFVLFWALAGVTFLQFFSRYVLNNSFTWTEEIGRYLLMWVTFFGTAIVFRKRTNIAVDVVVNSVPEPLGRAMRFVADCITLGFVALLAWFSWTVSGRMAIQRMTVFDVSMAVVYYGILVGCLLMLWRALAAFVANARRGWRADPSSEQLIID